MPRLRVAALCFVALAILIGFPGPARSASVPASPVEAAARVQTASISVGDRVLNTTVRHRAYAPHAGWTIDRGAVVERLIPRTVGVEQTWTFADRPAGDGALVVRVATSGSEYAGTDANGLTFRDVRTGAVWTYGHGTWIDADGRRTVVSAQWAGNAIALRIPADVVAGSSYPAVLDPYVGPAFPLDEPIGDVPTAGEQTNSNAAYGDGMWLVAWVDNRMIPHRKLNIYATRIDDEGNVLDPQGIRVGEVVSTGGGTKHLEYPAVSYGDGKWLVVWREADLNLIINDEYALVYRFVYPDGSVSEIGEIDRDNDIGPPDVAFGENHWLVAWDDSRNSIWGYQDILAKYVESDGSVSASPLTISDASYSQLSPSVSYGGDRWMIAWEDERASFLFPSEHDIYAQTLSPSSPDTLVTNSADAYTPSVAYLNGEWLATWSEEVSTGTRHINARRLDGNVSPVGSVIPVSTVDEYAARPRVRASSTDWLVTWETWDTGEITGNDGQFITSTGTPYGGEQALPGTGTHRGEYATSWGDGGNWLLTWTSDAYSVDGDIVAMLWDVDGTPITPQVVVNRGANSQTESRIAFNGTNYLVVWLDNRDTGSTDYGSLYGVRVAPSGTVLDASPVRITGPDSSMWYEFVVASDGQDWAVVWKSHAIGDWMGQIVKGDGTLDGMWFPGTYAAVGGSWPALAYGSDTYLLAWHDERNGTDSDVYAQRIDSDGSLVGPELTIANGEVTQGAVSLGYADDHWLAVWSEYQIDEWRLYARLVGPDGTLMSDSFELNTDMTGNIDDLTYGGGIYLATAGADAVRIDTMGNVLDSMPIRVGLAHSTIFDGDGFAVYLKPYSSVRRSWVNLDGAVTEYDVGVIGGKVWGVQIFPASSGPNETLVTFPSFEEGTTQAARLRGHILRDLFLARSVNWNADGSALVSWQANASVDPVGVNIYRSTSATENFQKLNASPLPLDSVLIDEYPIQGVRAFYWPELVFADGSSQRDGKDIVWLDPQVVEVTFNLAVRESTVATTEGGVSAFDIEVTAQKGYTGKVSLGVSGLGAGAESWSLDPATVDVPGHSTLTIQWDPLTDAPVGSPIEDAFQVTATEVTGTAATTKTVDLLGVVIDPADEYLTQFVYPAEPEAGHEAEVFGRLAPPVPGQTVTVNTGTTLDVFTATTDDSGFFSLTVPVAAAGAVSFTSSTTGATTAPYQTAAKRGRRSIRLTATTADGQFDPSDLVSIDGEIDPHPGGGAIYLEIGNPDDTYAFKGNVTVDDYGAFHQSFYAQEGVTEVNVEFAADADYYNASARLNVPVNAPIGMAIVVAAGGETGNTLWNATGVLTDHSYNVYKGRLIPEDRIRYLHPDALRDPDGDGTPETAAAPTKANLQSSIETWASNLADVSTTYAPFKTPLTIYIVGTEVTPSVIRLNEAETLSATELGGYLDAFLSRVQDRYTDPDIPAPSSVPVNVVLECPDSGAFVSELASRDRIVVTSTGGGTGDYPGENIISPDGTLAFSRYFYDEIGQGKYIATGWATGAVQMLMESWYSQWPLIEANGNGIPNEDSDQINGDGAGDKVLEYRNTFERRPMIDSMFSGLTITPDDDGTGTLWAKILDYGESIDRVKCVILPPEDSGEPMREYRMHWNASQHRYELNHDGFRHKGIYKILITAVDEDEDAALPWVSLVDVRGDTLGEDVTPPEDVTEVYTQEQDGQVYLSWTESISSDVAGYYVYTKPAGGAYGTGVYAGNNDHYTVTGLTNGVGYQFKITAIDEVPNESAGVETGTITPRGAEFAADQTEVLPGTTVQFADLSTGSPIAWSWDLDGDLVEDSTAQHPSYLYAALGTYTVTLTATYADGSDQEIKAGYISVQGQVADFSATPTHGTLPMSVQFTDESVSENTITAWSWDMDGDDVSDSSDQNPSYQYDAPGEYDVTLTVTTSGGSDSETKDGYVVVSCPTPDPAFTSDVTSGPAPLDVTFTSTTTAPVTGCDPTAWSWTFGDSGTGSGEITAHTYETEGYYDVCLTVTVPGTSAQTCVVDYIDVGGGCASGNLCLTLLLAGYWDGTEQSTEAYLTVDFYADPDAAPSYRITNVQLDMDGTAIVDLTAAGVVPGAYYVVARPLNHLDLMSEGALTVGGLTAAGLDADFSDPTQVACGEAALVFVGDRWCAPGGDASGDGQVDLSDYSLLAQQWGLAGPEADFTGDAVVDLSDYSNLAQSWSREMCSEVPAAE